MDSYEILEIPRDASIPEIKETFRKKAKECHPDRGGDTNTFIQLKEAYEKIMEDKKKETQSDNLTSTMAEILRHHKLLNRFYTLLNGEVPRNNYHWKI